MIKKDLSITKTARYFLNKEPDQHVKEVWFICHGYGQLANYFLKKFDAINTQENLLVSIEGLHRFYTKGYTGRVGATWMTKEDRLSDIEDYVNFLNNVYDSVLAQLFQKVKINVLGFSQGTTVVSRWLSHGNVNADKLILWAGAFPSDFDFKRHKTVFNSMNIKLVIGDKDEFISFQQVKEHQEYLDSFGMKYQLISFNGNHDIDPVVLKGLA